MADCEFFKLERHTLRSEESQQRMRNERIIIVPYCLLISNVKPTQRTLGQKKLTCGGNLSQCECDPNLWLT